MSLSEDKWPRNDRSVLERWKLPQTYEAMILSTVSFTEPSEIIRFWNEAGFTIALSYCRTCPDSTAAYAVRWGETNCWTSAELLDQAVRSWSAMLLWPWSGLVELPPLKVPGQQRSLISRNGSPEGKNRKEKNLQIHAHTEVHLPYAEDPFLALCVSTHLNHPSIIICQ